MIENHLHQLIWANISVECLDLIDSNEISKEKLFSGNCAILINSKGATCIYKHKINDFYTN